MSNKYLGHSGGLIGPVEKTFGRPDYWNTESEKEHNEVYEAWQNYLASLPRIPCEGWKPEEGREYIRGVHFELNQIAECKDGRRSEWVTVAVPLPAAPQEAETDLQKFLAKEKGAISKIKQSDLKPGDKFVWFGSKGYELYSFRCDRGYGIGTNEGLIVNWSGLCGLFTPAPQEGADLVEKHRTLSGIVVKRIENTGDEILKKAYTRWLDVLNDLIEGKRETLLTAFGIIARSTPTYPDEFVEWMAQHTLRKRFDQYQYYKSGALFTKEQLFTEWKRIKSQSK